MLPKDKTWGKKYQLNYSGNSSNWFVVFQLNHLAQLLLCWRRLAWLKWRLWTNPILTRQNRLSKKRFLKSFPPGLVKESFSPAKKTAHWWLCCCRHVWYSVVSDTDIVLFRASGISQPSWGFLAQLWIYISNITLYLICPLSSSLLLLRWDYFSQTCEHLTERETKAKVFYCCQSHLDHFSFHKRNPSLDFFSKLWTFSGGGLGWGIVEYDALHQF